MNQNDEFGRKIKTWGKNKKMELQVKHELLKVNNSDPEVGKSETRRESWDC